MSTLTGANLVVFCNCYQTTKLAGIFLSSALFIPFFILVYEKKGPSVKTIAGSKKRIHYLTFVCVITYQKQRVSTSQFKRNQRVSNDLPTFRIQGFVNESFFSVWLRRPKIGPIFLSYFQLAPSANFNFLISLGVGVGAVVFK